MQRRIGIVVVVVGVFIIANTLFNLIATEKIIDLGLIKINMSEGYYKQWPPLIGSVLLGGGFIIVALDKRIV